MRVGALLLASLLLGACGDDDEQTTGAVGETGLKTLEQTVVTASDAAIEPPALATGTDKQVPEPGQAIYRQYCGDCHDDGEGHPGTMRLAVRLDNAVLRTRVDLSPAYVKWVVRNGYQMMPPFRPTEIADSDLDALAAYVAAATIAHSE